MNNDELQKAIDDITRDNSAPADAPATDAAAENEQLANELAQPAAAPAAEADAAVSAPDFGVAPAPAIPDAPGMPPVEAAPEAVAPVVAPEAPEEPGAAPVAEPAPAKVAPATDSETLEEAMKELYPLLDRVSLPIEEKFDITLKYGEPAKALEIAKQYTDETAKANALLEIVNKLR